MSTDTTVKKLPPAISIRQLFKLLKNPIKQLPELVAQYPDAFRFPLRTMPSMLVQRPEYAKHVLQTNRDNFVKGAKYGVLKPFLGNGLLLSEGDFWKKQRRLAQPAFHRKRLELVVAIARLSTQQMLDRWKDRPTIDLTNEMGVLTIEIVSKALFGTDVPSNVENIRKSVEKLNKTASKLARLPMANMDWLMHVPYTPGVNAAMKTLDNAIFGIIEARRRSDAKHDDLLAMLMEAVDEGTGESMTDQQLRDELMTLFIAGHETTVLSISWTVYLLTQHPEVVSKIREEATNVIGRENPTFSDLPKLTYLTQVINEGMRLYPPVYIVGRKALRDDEIGEYYIPAGHNVGVNIYGMHRHPEYWDRPDDFIPDRFEDFDLKGDNRFLFLPFGGGPRICIGNNFAMMEMQIIISMLVQNSI